MTLKGRMSRSPTLMVASAREFALSQKRSKVDAKTRLGTHDLIAWHNRTHWDASAVTESTVLGKGEDEYKDRNLRESQHEGQSPGN